MIDRSAGEQGVTIEEAERLMMLDGHGLEECVDCLAWHAQTELARRNHTKRCPKREGRR